MNPDRSPVAPGRRRQPVKIQIGLAVALVLSIAASLFLINDTGLTGEPPSSDPSGFRFLRKGDPNRTEVVDRRDSAVATFTDGARTVTVTGPRRVFAEPRYTAATVSGAIWVRLAPRPWYPGAEQEPWVRNWLSEELNNTEPDVLSIATQYFQDAPDLIDSRGTRYAGNASFGPELDSGKRRIGADFNDYLGIPWQFADGGMMPPDPMMASALDCSGYLRLVFGYRLGYPLLAGGDLEGGLPRRADIMARSGPGVSIIDDHGEAPTHLSRLRPGDLLFFTTDDAPDIDHSASYLGMDSDDRHRFVSSRDSADGPTMGDLNGPSVLDGDGFFAQRFRSARRI
jgi:cell wall-associated NlpC family hydrolase